MRSRAKNEPGTAHKHYKTMNRIQESQVGMFYTTDGVLTDNNTLWTGSPAMVALVTEFRLNIGSIENATEQQVKDITGHAKAKAAALTAMVNKTLHVGGAGMAYAEATGNRALAEEMNVVPSELRGYRDAIVAQRCQGVHTAANANAAALVGYGVAAADLTDLQATIDAYLALVASPRTKIAQRSAKTAELGALIRDTSKLLDRRMDMLMRGFMVSQPDFFSQYTKARQIVDAGSRKSGEEEKAA